MLSEKALDRLANDIRKLNTAANDQTARPVTKNSQAARLNRDTAGYKKQKPAGNRN